MLVQFEFEFELLSCTASGMRAGSPPPSKVARNILGHHSRAFSFPQGFACVRL